MMQVKDTKVKRRQAEKQTVDLFSASNDNMGDSTLLFSFVKGSTTHDL